MFYDQTIVRLKAGNGGHGAMSFRREKYLPKGGPDGGDGGKGGDVIIECDENVGDLRQFHFKPNYAAKAGGGGAGRQKTGRTGESIVLKVPPGTVITDLQSDIVVLEMLDHGQQVVLLNGGKGGRGNYGFRSSTNQAPRQFTEGEPGQTGEYRFTLKSIADVGLLGFPNAGKSTLIGILTNAKPRTGAYPFTTLNPTVGVMEDPETFARVKIADIPGLIEGASENRGLGHRFLRHIERCKVILFLIDLSGIDDRDPVEDYAQLEQELGNYSKELLERPRIVVANKMDTEAAQKNLPKFKKKIGGEIFSLSNETGEGLDALRAKLLAIASTPAPTLKPAER